MTTKWIDIKGYEGLYQVKNTGNVKSLYTGKILIANAPSADYNRVFLYKEGYSRLFSVHRLVALHFVENPLNKPIVNHKDRNKKNNHYLNLEWVTYAENSQHYCNLNRVYQDSFKIGRSVRVIKTNKEGKIVTKHDKMITIDTDPNDFYIIQELELT